MWFTGPVKTLYLVRGENSEKRDTKLKRVHLFLKKYSFQNTYKSSYFNFIYLYISLKW